MATQKLKRCARGEWKPISEFGKRKEAKDGLQWLCNEHIRKSINEWRANNPEKIRKYSKSDRKTEKEWRAKNPNYQREWRAKNPEKSLKYQKEWRAKNPNYQKEWRAKNRKKSKSNP